MRHILNFEFLEKGLEIVFLPHFVYDFSKCFSCSNLLTDQASFSDCFYFLRYWAMCVFKLFVFQVVTSKILKLTFLSDQAVFLNKQI